MNTTIWWIGQNLFLYVRILQDMSVTRQLRCWISFLLDFQKIPLIDFQDPTTTLDPTQLNYHDTQSRLSR